MRNRNFADLRSLIIGTVFGAIVLAGTALTVTAQNVNKEYRDWQRAQARAQQEHQDYLRTRSGRDYNQWQAAERRARQEYQQYQRASNRYGSAYTSGSYNNNQRYRVVRNGSYYSTDYRGAELLRQAVRNGYSQGYQQGRNDSRYNRMYDYNGVSIYRSGTYGYQSHVDMDQYQYYFQQGFQKGYEDGFYRRNQYGNVSGNSFNILGTVLNTILNIAADND